MSAGFDHIGKPFKTFSKHWSTFLKPFQNKSFDTFPDLRAVEGKVVLGHTANALTDSVAEVPNLHLSCLAHTQPFSLGPTSENSQTILSIIWNLKDSRIVWSILLVISIEFLFTQVNIGLALALLRGLAKDEVRSGAWQEKKVLVAISVMMTMATTTSATRIKSWKSTITKMCRWRICFWVLARVWLEKPAASLASARLALPQLAGNKQTEISTKKQIFGFSRLLLFCCSVENAFRLLPFGISRLIYTNRSQSELASQVIPFWGDVSL